MTKLLTHPFVFALIIIGDLAGRIANSQIMDYIFKPLLMLWLLGYFLIQIKPVKQSPDYHPSFARLIILALVFSWLGDVSLMFVEQAAIFFVVGLGNFLIAHIFYVLAYHRSVALSQKQGYITKKPLWILPFLLVGVGLYGYLFPSLKDLAIPVAVYATTIVLMGIFALNRKGTTSTLSYQYIFFGALLFIVSDSCIAINKFVTPLPQAGLIIMVTYIAAQYMIVKGSVATQVKSFLVNSR
ncbi:MAG TPA: lysoplasmalogenase [Microscillaceae bacterium]|nr:lysoplasmalogenase [Microscillaceae bacterium]